MTRHQHPRAALRGEVARALKATWRLIVGVQVTPLDKQSALARASAAAGSARQRTTVWLFADAVLVHRQWMCVLEDDHEAYVVEVHSNTGQARVIARATRGRPERTSAPPRCRHTGRGARIRPSAMATRLRHRSPIPPR